MIESYPRPFYILLALRFAIAIGVGMYWPFLLVYLREQLGLPLTTATMLLTLQATVGMFSISIAGLLVDRFGRKRAIYLSLGARSFVMLAMIFSRSLVAWIALVSLVGLLAPAFQVSCEATIADMVEPNRRSRAYSLLRIAVNSGWMIGPALGGILVTISYTPAFLTCAVTMAVCALLIAVAVPETLPDQNIAFDALIHKRPRLGYGQVLRDHRFLVFCAVFSLIPLAQNMVLSLTAEYMKTGFGLAERYFGFMMTTNAAIIVLFELEITYFVRRFQPERVLAVGAALYSLGMLCLIRATHFEGFLLAIMVTSFAEVILMPNSLTYASNLAPLDMRGRYMGFFGFARQGGAALGPMLGGLLSASIAPVAMWYGGALVTSISMCGFLFLATQERRKQKYAAGD